MSAETRRPRLEAPPRGQWPLLFQRADLGMLVLGDRALAEPMARAGLAHWALDVGLAQLSLWGRAAAAHGDAIAEQWERLEAPEHADRPQLTSYDRFEAIDLSLTAEAIAANAAALSDRATCALFDRDDPLEGRLLRELRAVAEVVLKRN